MGDRRQVIIQEGSDKIVLYTHWGGSELPDVVRDSLLRGKERWDDAPYLSRIIFCDMIKDRERGLTGFGIWSSEMDSEYPDVYVDVGNQTVSIGEEKKSFAQYVSEEPKEPQQ